MDFRRPSFSGFQLRKGSIALGPGKLQVPTYDNRGASISTTTVESHTSHLRPVSTGIFQRSRRGSGSYSDGGDPEPATPNDNDIPLTTPAAAPFFTGFSFLPASADGEIDPKSISRRASRFVGTRGDDFEKVDIQSPDKLDQPPMAPIEATETTVSRLPGEYFRSRRTGDGPIEKPWLENKDPRRKWASIFPLIGLFIGFCIAAVLIWDGLRTVETHQYCLIMDDNFSGAALDSDIWTKEAQVDGYGNGQFEQTTVNDENVFLKDGMLWIKPTLQDASLIEKNSVINLTATGVCTGTEWYQCVSTTNTTNGTIVNPVKSGRINTKKSKAIQYGRVEVSAKLPRGDWLWPAIWMLPVNDTYGDWPLSGEIDLVESRGNNHTYVLGGNNIISSALHWGPDQTNDAWWRTYKKKAAFRKTFADEFHTYGMEWSERYIYTFIDSRLTQVLYNKFNKPLWERGDFPLANSNGTAYVDPWSQTGHDSTPFDQPFYLILNVAVGGDNGEWFSCVSLSFVSWTCERTLFLLHQLGAVMLTSQFCVGWFEDGKDGKPWVNKSPSEMKDFWNARDEWQPTWESDGQLIVKSVKMWQQQGYRGC